MLALYVQKLDGSKRFGPCAYPYVEISSKFEVLGPGNANGRVAGDLVTQNPSKTKLINRDSQTLARTLVYPLPPRSRVTSTYYQIYLRGAKVRLRHRSSRRSYLIVHVLLPITVRPPAALCQKLGCPA